MSDLHRAIQERAEDFRPQLVPPFGALRDRKRRRDQRRAGTAVALSAATVAVVALGTGSGWLSGRGPASPQAPLASDTQPLPFCGPQQVSTSGTEVDALLSASTPFLADKSWRVVTTKRMEPCTEPGQAEDRTRTSPLALISWQDGNASLMVSATTYHPANSSDDLIARLGPPVARRALSQGGEALVFDQADKAIALAWTPDGREAQVLNNKYGDGNVPLSPQSLLDLATAALSRG